MALISDPLSHAGLTLAAVFAVESVIRRVLARSTRQKIPSSDRIHPVKSRSHSGRARRWTVDYRLVIIGSLLPDLIDKSVGPWLLPEIFSHADRSFGHTLVFNSSLLVFSLLLIPVNRSLGLLVFSIASAGHLLLDRMWESPRTLFWPQYGLNYGGAEFDLSPPWLHSTQTKTGPVLFDWTGALLLLIITLTLRRRSTLFK